MGRHRLEFKLKKPNKHHRYWRYVLSSDPKQSEISTQTKVKYEAERIAKEVCAKAKEEMSASPLFGDYAKDFWTSPDFVDCSSLPVSWSQTQGG